MLAHVGSDSMHFFTDTVRWSAEVESLPKTYVRLLQDRAVPGPDQDEMIRRLGPGVTEEVIDAGHEVMITRPAELAAIVTRIVLAADRDLGRALRCSLTFRRPCPRIVLLLEHRVRYYEQSRMANNCNDQVASGPGRGEP